MNMSVLTIILQGQSAAGGGTPFAMPIMLIGMVVVMYFFMIRPQQKKAKEQRKWVDELKKGDKVVTVSGMHGVVSQITPENPVVVIEISINTFAKFDKSAISLEMTKAAYPTA